MNTALRTTLTLALGMSASSSAILAQTSAAPLKLAAVSPATVVAGVVAPEKSYDPAAVRTRLARADELVQRGRIPAASREYIAVAKMQRAQNVLPSEAIWKLAELHHAHGQSPERTANVLVALAMDAERFEEPQIEAKALLEAAILYNKAFMPAKAAACVDRLDWLMTSPRISDEFRREVQQRIVRK